MNRTIFGTHSIVFVLLLLLVMAAFPLHAALDRTAMTAAEAAEAVNKELVTLQDGEFEDTDTLMDYWFLVSYNLMLQEKGLGGILAFDPESMEYVAGYRMRSTPEDFFTNLPNSTLMSPMFMPAGVARMIFLSLGDADSIARISYLDDTDAILLISVLKFYDNEEVVLEEAAFSLARQAIEGSFGASGLEIPEAYAVYERSGVSQDELVERILSGESTPSELSIEAIRMMKAEAEASAADGPDILACLFIALLVIAVLLAVLVVIILIRMRRPRS